MNIRSIYLIAQREVHRLLKRKALFFFILFAPVLSFLLIEYMFSAGAIREIPVTIVDLDHTDLSRELCQDIEASPLAKISSYSANLQEAKNKVFTGEVQGVVIFPEDLEKQVHLGEQVKVELFSNNSNLVLGGNLQSGIYKAIAEANLDIKVERAVKDGLYLHQAKVKAEPVGLDIHQLFNPFSNYAYFLVVGLLPLMLTIFTFLIGVYSLGSELKESTAGDLMKIAKGKVINAISGKYLPYTLLFFIDAIAMDLILFNILGVPFKGSIWVLLGSQFLLIIAYQALSVLFLAITNNMRLSLSLGSAYTLLSFTFSGLTFPLMAMPLIAKMFACIFPYTFWIRIFIGESLRGQPLYYLRIEFLVLILFFLIGMFAFPSIKRRLTDPSKWGKR